VIKFIVAALWISAVTVGAMMYAANSREEAVAAEPAAPLLGGLDYIKTEIMSVPVLADGGIAGYFLARLVYTIEPDKAKMLTVPAGTLIGDELYTYLYSNPNIDFTKVDSFDLDPFREQIRDRINKRVGEELIHEVLVEQIDFLSKAEIRDNTLRRRAAGAAVQAAKGAAAAPAGHGESSSHGEPAAH
jgi:hypothetical protein